MINSQTDIPIGEAIVRARVRYESSQARGRATHIVIGRLTYEKLRQEFYLINGIVLPAPDSSQACELMGMMFSFINYDNYLAVR